MSNQSFIKQVAASARNIQKEHGILPSLIIAQACLESNYGKSGLAIKGNNLFGIKGVYNGDYVEMNTREWNDQTGWHTTKAKFRKYPSWSESLNDHAMLFVNGLSREKINRYAGVIGETNSKKATRAVKNAGYATDPNYPELLDKIIEQYSLTQYDYPNISKANKSYTVKPGDTLSEIARKKNTTVTAIIKVNNLQNPDFIKVGEVLHLPASSSKETYYTVNRGDTLSKVAAAYQVDMDEIVRLNRIDDPNKIYPGQRIRIF